MMKVLRVAAWVSLLCCGLLSAQIAGPLYQEPRGYDPNTPRHDISGTVINAVSGNPIPHALVQAFGPYQGATFTDSEGSFRFQGVPEARINFIARKPGFFNADEMASGGGRVRTQVQISADMPPLALKLTPEGVVTGVVSGDDGEPLENVNIRLRRQVVTNGRKHWEERQWARSNEDGEFRAANLPPGTYFLLAEGAPAAPPRAPGEPALGYALAYYPGVPDLASASPIEVRGGQTVRLDFRLRGQPVYEVSGAVTGLPPDQRGVEVQFTTQSGEPIDAGLLLNPFQGSFTAKLAAGTYTIRASSSEPPPRRSLRASLTLTVAGNLRNLRLPLQPAISIPIVVRTEFARPPSVAGSGIIGGGAKQGPLERYASVQLVNIDDPRRNAYSSMERGPEGETYAVRNVEPGRYQARISANGPWYVQAASCGPTDLLREPLAVAQGAESRPIEIVLRDDGGSITGSVVSGNVAASAMVLAVPGFKTVPPAPQYASENGFTFHMLPPGDYLLLAFDTLDGLEYDSRDALDPYLSRATRVSLSNNSNSTVTLTLIKRGER